MKHLMFLLTLAISLPAQVSPHSVTLNWADTNNPAGTTYNVYRAPGVCSSTSSFTRTALAIAVKTWVDTPATPGNWCYQITAALNGVESSPSNQAPAAVPPYTPTNVTVTVQ